MSRGCAVGQQEFSPSPSELAIAAAKPASNSARAWVPSATSETSPSKVIWETTAMMGVLGSAAAATSLAANSAAAASKHGPSAQASVAAAVQGADVVLAFVGLHPASGAPSCPGFGT